MASNYTVFALSEAISPITHAARSSGNESLVMREPVVTDQGVQWVPCLSGNALRHRCVREPGWRWLIERYELAGKLTLLQLNFFLHGGNLTEGGGREDTARIADFQRLFPLGRLLGGSLPDQILAGSLLMGRGTLVCEENRATMQAMLPAAWELPTAALRPAEHYVSSYQYTRADAAKTAMDLLPTDPPGERDSNLMIMAGQAVTRGACFLHTMIIQHSSRLELGALLLSLSLWQSAGGTIGGQGAKGHGKLRTAIHCDADGDPVAEYMEHVETTKAEAVEWIGRVFPGKEAMKKKGKKAEAASG